MGIRHLPLHFWSILKLVLFFVAKTCDVVQFATLQHDFAPWRKNILSHLVCRDIMATSSSWDFFNAFQHLVQQTHRHVVHCKILHRDRLHGDNQIFLQRRQTFE